MKNNENNSSESQRNMNRPKKSATILPKMNNTNNINNNNINIHKNEHNIVNNIVLTNFFLQYPSKFFTIVTILLLLFTIFYIFNNYEQYYKQLQTIWYTIETILL